MTTQTALLDRLEAIGHSLAATGQALALIGLGSVGRELDRIDDYSDLDFFAIVKPGQKQYFIEHLDWLSSICPLSYAFLNTFDGYKALYADGIFCEFAVFELPELAHIPFAPGRIVWKAEGVDGAIAEPQRVDAPPHAQPLEWILGEALTNLYVGMGRYRRGEKLSAQRFVQHYAVDRVLELAAQLEPAQPAHRDPFSLERRFEQRFPQAAAQLPLFVQGYERSPESALAILAFLEAHFAVNPAIAGAIRERCH